MSDTTRTLLIAPGVALLVVVLVPLLFMGAMMGPGLMGGAWIVPSAALVAGAALLALGLRSGSPRGEH